MPVDGCLFLSTWLQRHCLCSLFSCQVLVTEDCPCAHRAAWCPYETLAGWDLHCQLEGWMRLWKPPKSSCSTLKPPPCLSNEGIGLSCHGNDEQIGPPCHG